jgi:hypothetical protein
MYEAVSKSFSSESKVPSEKDSANALKLACNLNGSVFLTFSIHLFRMSVAYLWLSELSVASRLGNGKMPQNLPRIVFLSTVRI